MIEARLAEHSLDIGFVDSVCHQHNVHTEPCCSDDLQVVCSPGFALARFNELTASALLGHPYVSRERGSGTRALFEAFLRAAGVSPEAMNLVMELGSPEALKGVVETGLGFAVMSRALISKEQALGTLIAIALSPRLMHTVAMAYPKDGFRSRLLNTFAESAARQLRACEDTST